MYPDFHIGLTDVTTNLNGAVCRPEAQLKAIVEWHETHPCKHWCFDSFSYDYLGEFYNTTISHLYCDLDDNLNLIRVTPTGKITKHCIA